MLKQTRKKIITLSVGVLLFTSCDAVKRVKKNEFLLTKNSFIVNGKKNKSETISKLSFQKTNSTILGIPLRLHIYNMARENKDSIFDSWLKKKPNRNRRYIKIFSQKQLDKIKKTSLGLNTWLKNTGEKPEIIDSLKINKTKINLERYYFSKGWFDRIINFNIDTIQRQRATLEYKIQTGDPHKIGTFSSEIETSILDSIFRQSKVKSFIKKGNQFNISDFEKERERVNDNFRNLGIYHFSQDYISFENDTIGKSLEVDVKMKIANRIVRNGDSLSQKPFKAYKIKDVNIYTDKSTENRSQLDLKKIVTYNLSLIHI